MGYLTMLEPPDAALTDRQMPFAVSISAAFLAVAKVAIMISHNTFRI